jgi:hypothetical protein
MPPDPIGPWAPDIDAGPRVGAVAAAAHLLHHAPRMRGGSLAMLLDAEMSGAGDVEVRDGHAQTLPDDL